MKILFVNRHAHLAGGAEKYILAVSRMLRADGHAIGMVHWDDQAGREDFDFTARVPGIWDKELRLDAADRDALDTAIASFGPDVIYLHNIENGKAVSCLAGKARTVWFAHDYKTVDPDGKMLLQHPLEANRYPLSPACFLRAYARRSMPTNPVKAVRAYLRAKGALGAMKRIKDVIVASQHMKSILAMNGVNGANIHVLPYFIDFRNETELRHGSGNRILFVGRLANGKGLDLLLEAVKDVKNGFFLDVAGAGPLEGFYRAKAQKLRIAERVVFHGWVDHGKLAELYERSSFLVVPSVWPEPFGICGIEAAYFGKPAVAFDVGGISDWLIDGETGFLVKPYDKQEMASKISHLLNNPDMVRGLGARARELALQKYNPEDHINKLLEIFASS